MSADPSYQDPAVPAWARGGQGDSGTFARHGRLIACELCLRETHRYTLHHLVPRSQGGRSGPKARLCSTCHRQLHALFSEATLARQLYSIELLRADPQVSSYLKWAQKQRGPTAFRVRRANHRR